MRSSAEGAPSIHSQERNVIKNRFQKPAHSSEHLQLPDT